MHFSAGSASQKMIMELMSSASDVCMLYGICAYLERRKRMILEVQKTLRRLFHLRESHKQPVRHELLWQTVYQLVRGQQRETDLSARVSAVEGDVSSARGRTAEENLQQIPAQTVFTETVVGQADDVQGDEIVRLCNVANYAESLKIEQYLQTRPAKNSLRKLCILRGEDDRPTSFI